MNPHSIGIACEGRFDDLLRGMPDPQFNALVWLIRHLRAQFGDLHISGHRDHIATACPGRFFPLDEVQRLTFRGNTNNNTTQENTEMTQELFNQMMDQYLIEQRARPVSAWATEHWEQARRRGWLDGYAPQNPLTREQAATVLCRIMGVGADVSQWAKDAWDKATQAGFVDGTNPGAPATREQVVLILDRLGLMD
jgi:hypothetical protein